MFYLKLYLCTLVGFLAIDAVWLTVVARGFYRRQLGSLLTVLPGLQAGSLRRTLLLGGFFGLVTYATYDLTNMATVKNWPWLVTLVDMAWGTVLAAAVSGIGYFAGRWLG